MGLQRLTSLQGVRQFMQLWHYINQLNISGAPDTVLWKFNGNGRYSARSAYNIQFHGSVQMDHCRTLWKAKITNKCKMFIWLMIQGCQQPIGLTREGQMDPNCSLCHAALESHSQLFLACPFAERCW
jgi:hypothetical protein